MSIPAPFTFGSENVAATDALRTDSVAHVVFCNYVGNVRVLRVNVDSFSPVACGVHGTVCNRQSYLRFSCIEFEEV